MWTKTRIGKLGAELLENNEFNYDSLKDLCAEANVSLDDAVEYIKAYKTYSRISKGKFAYYILLNHRCDNSSLDNYLNFFGVSLASANNYIREFRKRVVSPIPSDEDEALFVGYKQAINCKTDMERKEIQKHTLKTEYPEVEAIIEAYNNGSLEEFSMNCDLVKVQYHIRIFIKNNPESEKCELLKIIFAGIKNYRTLAEQARVRERNAQKSIETNLKRLDLTKEIMIDFINSKEYMPVDVLTKHKFTDTIFYEYFEILSEGDEETRELCREYLKVKGERELYLVESINKMADEIKNNKDYNMFDFYLVTKMKHGDFMKYANKALRLHLVDRISTDTIKNFGMYTFARGNLAFARVDENHSVDDVVLELFNRNISFGGRLLTTEEIKPIVEYFVKEDIPITANLYSGACINYLNGKFIFN